MKKQDALFLLVSTVLLLVTNLTSAQSAGAAEMSHKTMKIAALVQGSMPELHDAASRLRPAGSFGLESKLRARLNIKIPINPARGSVSTAVKTTAAASCNSVSRGKKSAIKKKSKKRKARSKTRNQKRKADSPAGMDDNEDLPKYVALTFDDGPSPTYTPKILEILKKEDIHATFFVIGREAKKYPELVEQIVADGHKIADHTMNHDEHLCQKSDARMESEILGTKELIESIVPGVTVEYYRAPGGNSNRHQRALAAGWGMKHIAWTVDTKDWRRPGVKSILATVKRQLHNGGIILMHDSGGNRSETVAALNKLIPKLKKQNYRFVFPDVALAARRNPSLIVATSDK